METLKMEKPKEVVWDYDKDADMLYISFGPPQEALTMDLGAGVLVRYLERTSRLVGFTIVGVSEVLGHPASAGNQAGRASG